MSTEAQARKIEKHLDQLGIPEGRNPPYQTTARGMFCYLAARCIGNKRITQTDLTQLANKAPRFIAGFWQAYNISTRSQCQFPIYEDYTSHLFADEFLSVIKGNAYFSKQPRLMPSIRQPAPATPGRCRAADIEQALARAKSLEERCLTKMQQLAHTAETFRLEYDPKSPYHLVDFVVRSHGVDWNAYRWTANMLIHLPDDYLMASLEIIRGQHQNGIHILKTVQAEEPEVEKCLQDIAIASGLPIKLYLAPATMSSRSGVRSVWIAYEGYGPTGQKTTERICTIGINHSREHIEVAIHPALSTQKARHKRFGPEPGKAQIPWKVDVVTARALRQCPDAEHALQRCIATGKARTESGLKLKIKEQVIYAEIAIGTNVVWKGTKITAKQSAPDSTCLAIEGRDIDAVVDAEMLKNSGTIKRARIGESYRKPLLTMEISPRTIPVTVFLSDILQKGTREAA